jgi:hypothetical protein
MKFRAIILLLLALAVSCTSNSEEARVFVFTDINIDKGDPDDRQSLVHLFWYADEIDIEGIVPDRWNAQGYEACMLALEAYATDYSSYDFINKGYPSASELENHIAQDMEHARKLFFEAASNADTPLYVLIWGNMENFGKLLREKTEVHQNIRVITIGTDLMIEEYRKHIPESWPIAEKPCKQYNWNGFGRNEIFEDTRFKDMWWLEINWTYEGMFSGEEPKLMYDTLSTFGNLGTHMIEVTENHPWARYFRVGDTPSVLYVIDPENDLNDPTQSSWAGRFVKPFPDERPNFYMDDSGPVDWDYENPCNTWENHRAMSDHAKGTLENERPAMYEALLEKLNRVYGNP